MNKLKQIYHLVRKTLSDDEVKFRLITTTELALIPVLTIAILMMNLSIVLRLDFAYFEAHGLPQTGEFKDVFYDYILSNAVDILPYIGAFFIALIFMGLYLSKMLLRPFKVIGDYCENWVNGKKATYDPDFFSDLKLLTGFSEYFFTSVERADKEQGLKPQNIPQRYTRIHKPIFEYSFFIQNLLFILMTSICVAIAVNSLAVSVHDHLIILVEKNLRKSEIVNHFFLGKHEEIWRDITVMVVLFHIFANLLFAAHLYRKVAIPAFGIFATFRSFLKGNYKTRVHLIGHYYVREQSRKINKYLDTIEKKLVEKNGSG
jgi:hypothetical protein